MSSVLKNKKFDPSKLIIPVHSGVYLMKDKLNNIIYIGKAKTLRNRVRSYFFKNQNYKTQKLVQNIHDIEFILTDNENEAYLLEANLIKKYRPIYNIELKDQQRYTYLKITNESFPRLTVARRNRNGGFLGGGKIFGPFTHGSSKLLSIGLLRKTFKIRICKTLPKEACLEYHLGNCDAPCEFLGGQLRYKQHVEDLESILKGKQDFVDFQKKLEAEMKIASQALDYEKAHEIYQTLQRLQNLQTKQKMDTIKNYDEEYFAIKNTENKAYVMSFRKSNGVIKDRNRFTFDLVGDNSFSNFLFQYYNSNSIPKYIITNVPPEKRETLVQILSKVAQKKIEILTPKAGSRKEMIDLIVRNIDLGRSNIIEPGLKDLQLKLHLRKVPHIIECFDISNHGKSFAVGSMSQFKDGRPSKEEYRRFKIKTVVGRNDYSMMYEIIKRRYIRLRRENSKFPDLVVIDGGRGHLRVALEALKNVGLTLPCISLAKENEEIFLPSNKNPVILPKENDGLKILQHVRDEAHRFGLTYNRSLRKF